jgi:hypothetical protein
MGLWDQQWLPYQMLTKRKTPPMTIVDRRVKFPISTETEITPHRELETTMVTTIEIMMTEGTTEMIETTPTWEEIDLARTEGILITPIIGNIRMIGMIGIKTTGMLTTETTETIGATETKTSEATTPEISEAIETFALGKIKTEIFEMTEEMEMIVDVTRP